MNESNPLPALRRWLRTHPAEGAELVLPRAEVERIQHELLRLQQSNDRLRKQNRKLRRRHGEPAGTEDDAASSE